MATAKQKWVQRLSASLSLGFLLICTQSTAKDRTQPRLDRFWENWLDRVEPLIGDAERRFFLDLRNSPRSDLDRERFVTAFW